MVLILYSLDNMNTIKQKMKRNECFFAFVFSPPKYIRLADINMEI